MLINWQGGVVVPIFLKNFSLYGNACLRLQNLGFRESTSWSGGLALLLVYGDLCRC